MVLNPKASRNLSSQIAIRRVHVKLQVKRTLLSLQPPSTSDKSPGHTGITYSMIKAAGPSLITLLHHFFDRLWALHSPFTHLSHLSVIPTPWTYILLSPIYKSGKIPPLDPLHPINYRGLALVDVMRMLWEKGVLHSLGNQVDRHNALI
jgi:hypothetical protein